MTLHRCNAWVIYAQVTFMAARSVTNLAVFPRIWACFFVELRVFLKTCGWLAFGLVLTEICLFFEDFCFSDCFFFKFSRNFMFQFAHKGILGVFLWRQWLEFRQRNPNFCTWSYDTVRAHRQDCWSASSAQFKRIVLQLKLCAGIRSSRCFRIASLPIQQERHFVAM